MRKRQLLLLVSIGLSILVLVSYWSVQENGFVNYDDPAYVTNNRHLQKGLSVEGLVWAFQTSAVSNWHPLTWISLMADHRLYGMNPGGYHWTSVILHLLSTVVLFLVLGRMTGRIWYSGVVAALFGVHPLHVESVAWVAERKDVLSGLFWMLGLWGYVRYSERPGLVRYGWVVLFFAMGLLSKPMVVTFPFVLLLLDWWPLGRMDFGRAGSKRGDGRDISGMRGAEGGGQADTRLPVSRLILEKGPLFILAAAGSFITFHIQNKGEVVATLDNLPFADRLANAAVAYAGYLLKMIWPFNLAVFYPHPGTWPTREVLLSCGLLVLVSWFAALRIRRQPYLLFGWLWYLGMLVPVIGFVQVGTQSMADRYTYLPLIGIFIAIAWLGGEVAARRRAIKPLSVLLIGGILATLVFFTREQVFHWRGSEPLFTHALNVTERNYVARNNLGKAMVAAGKYPEAIAQYREAIPMSPYFMPVHNNLGVALMEAGRFEEAMVSFEEALRIKPGDGIVHMNRGEVLSRAGRLTEAIAEYGVAVKIAPDDTALRNNLGVALTLQGRLDEAIGEFREAIRLDPEYAGAHGNLGMILLGQGSVDDAIEHLRRAIRYRPEFANAHYELGLALKGKGMMDEASRHLQEARRINPDIEAVRRGVTAAHGGGGDGRRDR